MKNKQSFLIKALKITFIIKIKLNINEKKDAEI